MYNILPKNVIFISNIKYMYVLWKEEEGWQLWKTWQLETKWNKAGNEWTNMYMYVMKYA